MRLESMDYLSCPACNSDFQLDVKKQIEKEVLEGLLVCYGCGKHFDIKDGLPNLKFPEELCKDDMHSEQWHDQHAQNYNDRRWLFHFGLWDLALFETYARWQLIKRLELKSGHSVLEIAVGTGQNLPVIFKQIGRKGRIDGLDISSGMLNVAKIKMETRKILVEFIHANGAHLPYKSDKFDAVLEIGAMNQIGDKRRAINEKLRVAKTGAKILICDEGLAPGKENTWLGRRILKHDPNKFISKPPIEFLPINIKDVNVYWVWHGIFWVMEFRKT